MIKTVRLSMFGNENEWNSLYNQLSDELLNKYHLPKEEHNYNGSEEFTGWHMGNQCIVDVLEDVAYKLLQDYPQFKIDMRFEYLEKSDLNNFKVGESVIVGGMFGSTKGKVFKITDEGIYIKKHHSQTKGWFFEIGYPFNVVRV